MQRREKNEDTVAKLDMLGSQGKAKGMVNEVVLGKGQAANCREKRESCNTQICDVSIK